MTKPDGERIAILETHIDTILKQQETMQKDITVMRDILLQAKGARWLVVSAAAVSGFIVTYLPWLAQHLGILKNG